MPNIVFISPDGERREVHASAGISAMTAAKIGGVPGIGAECGGSLSCGTCHVYVGSDQFQKLPNASREESEMLEYVASEVRHNSRLSCQITLTEALDGLILEIPEDQY